MMSLLNYNLLILDCMQREDSSPGGSEVLWHATQQQRALRACKHSSLIQCQSTRLLSASRMGRFGCTECTLLCALQHICWSGASQLAAAWTVRVLICQLRLGPEEDLSLLVETSQGFQTVSSSYRTTLYRSNIFAVISRWCCVWWIDMWYHVCSHNPYKAVANCYSY